MNEPALSATEMLAWSNTTTDRWCRLATEQPHMLAIPCDIASAKSVGELLQHIVAVELRYAQRLASLPETPYSDVPFSTGAEILATHAEATAMLQQLLDQPDFDWEQSIQFQTIRAGEVRATRKAVFVHALMHGIRHFAQLATLVRQHGVKTDWPMDYLFMAVTKI